MSAIVWNDRLELSSAADKALSLAARFWFVVAVIGQWLFAAYVAAYYGGTVVRGYLDGSNRVMPRHIPGDTVGNFVLAMHLFFAVVILAGGPLQLVPQIRRYAPTFHRWNGRLYIPVVFVMSLGGLYMVWIRGTVGDFVQHVGVSLDAILIMTFAVLALHYALARDITTHRRWALRLFIVVNGVWFYRVGFTLWLIINRGPAAFDKKTFTGPFLSFWSFAHYLLPLAVLEVYLRARDRGAMARLATALGLLVVTLAMSAGIIGATMAMWVPRVNTAFDSRVSIASHQQSIRFKRK